MSQISSKSLRRWHESLLQKQSTLPQEDRENFSEEVKEFMEQAKKAGNHTYSLSEREQLRANLRYWANYLYNVNGIFPDIELAPVVSKGRFLVISSGMMILLVIVALAIGSFITPLANFNIISPSQGTTVGQTQTAIVWTPTWTVTPDPPENKIVEWLNGEFINADPLEQTLDARYLVVGISFPFSPGSSSQVFRVDLRCECASSTNCCVPERMFVVLITAMKGSKDKIIKWVPSNVATMKVICYDHASQINVIGTDWSKVKGYLDGNISGYELGAQVYRTTFP